MGEALRAGTEESALGLVLMHAHPDLQGSWAALDDHVRSGTPAGQRSGTTGWIERYEEDGGLGAIFDRGTSALGRTLARALLGALDLSSVQHVVDVGGGRGTLLMDVLRGYPGLRGTVYDLPRAADQAAVLLAAAGLSDRCAAIGGDMFEHVPGEGDLYLMSRILHDWEDEPASTVLRNCAREMGHAGRIALLKRVLPEQDSTPVDMPAQFLADLHMLVRTGGRERTRAEYEALLARAGLWMDEILPTDTPWSVVLSHRV